MVAVIRRFENRVMAVSPFTAESHWMPNLASEARQGALSNEPSTEFTANFPSRR